MCTGGMKKLILKLIGKFRNLKIVLKLENHYFLYYQGIEDKTWRLIVIFF